MARSRRTISLKPEVDEVIDDKRGKKTFSTYVNDHFEEEFKPEVEKKKKEIATKKKDKNSPIPKSRKAL